MLEGATLPNSLLQSVCKLSVDAVKKVRLYRCGAYVLGPHTIQLCQPSPVVSMLLVILA
jgi:hypothetical protein